MFLVQTPLEFLNDFLEASSQAQHSICLQSMCFDPDGVIQEIEAGVTAAAGRGVPVNITIDWLTFHSVEGHVHLWPSLDFQHRAVDNAVHRARVKMFQRLRQVTGIHLVTTNRPRLIPWIFPIFRRNHIKMYIVDDKVAWMGGVNLMDSSFHQIDVMIKITEPKLIAELAQQFLRVNAARPKKDFSVDVGPEEKLFVDSGHVGKSIIFDQALKMVAEAKSEITFMSQAVPDGRLLNKMIKAAQRGVNVRVITSNPEDQYITRFPSSMTFAAFKRKMKKASLANFQLIHLNNCVHAKILFVDKQQVFLGSHNFSEVGVWLGTEEISLYSINADLVGQTGQFIEHCLVTNRLQSVA